MPDARDSTSNWVVVFRGGSTTIRSEPVGELELLAREPDPDADPLLGRVLDAEREDARRDVSVTVTPRWRGQDQAGERRDPVADGRRAAPRTAGARPAPGQIEVSEISSARCPATIAGSSAPTVLANASRSSRVDRYVTGFTVAGRRRRSEPAGGRGRRCAGLGRAPESKSWSSVTGRSAGCPAQPFDAAR